MPAAHTHWRFCREDYCSFTRRGALQWRHPYGRMATLESILCDDGLFDYLEDYWILWHLVLNIWSANKETTIIKIHDRLLDHLPMANSAESPLPTDHCNIAIFSSPPKDCSVWSTEGQPGPCFLLAVWSLIRWMVDMIDTFQLSGGRNQRPLVVSCRGFGV